MEKITDIAKAITIHRNLERTTDTKNNAVGRIKTIFNGEEKQFWIINKESLLHIQKDFLGNILPNDLERANKPYEKDGFPISKNSMLGGKLLSKTEGMVEISSPEGPKEVIIHNRAVYDPCDTNLAKEIIINLSGDSQTHTFALLSDILFLQKAIDEDKEKLARAEKDKNANAIEQLVKGIEEKENERREKLDEIKLFIRQVAQLRYQPILDPIQESVKRSKIFNGNLIINGGPGTGKTTSLIQRIKFLTSQTITEYINISKDKQDVLFNQSKSWIFFSPNELLSLFLKSSMSREELMANEDTIKVWSVFKNNLFQLYKLTDSQTRRPFLAYNNSEASLLPNDYNKLNKFTKGFEKSFIKHQVEKLEKIKSIEVKLFDWRAKAEPIQNDIKLSSISNLKDLLMFYFNISELYGVNAVEISSQYNEEIRSLAGGFLILLKNNEDEYKKILETFANESSDSNPVGDEDESEDEIESEDFDELALVQNRDNTEFRFLQFLKSLIRKSALKQFDSSVRLSARDSNYLSVLPKIEQNASLEKLGQLAFYKKYFDRITKGIIANLYREISVSYKKFRKDELTIKSKNWNLKILEDLVVKNQNKRLHIDEQAFLIYFINSLNVSLAKNLPTQYRDLRHSFIDAYKDNCKAVIGIDEATDFALIDLLCMSSLNHPNFSSVTLSGDLMQKITKSGINSWDDYTRIFKNTEVKNLEISYRQSQTLLDLAKVIYSKSNGQEPTYKSFMRKASNEPVPLLYISSNENDKIQWLAERIIELRKIYDDTIPSIAIFLPSEDGLESFAKALGLVDCISDVSIKVKACRDGEVLGDSNTVRVFSIDKIKGLEFQAVFFHNADEVKNYNISADLMYKYLYVGLSRASFYLGMTFSDELVAEWDFLSGSFEQANTWN